MVARVTQHLEGICRPNPNPDPNPNSISDHNPNIGPAVPMPPSPKSVSGQHFVQITEPNPDHDSVTKHRVGPSGGYW